MATTLAAPCSGPEVPPIRKAEHEVTVRARRLGWVVVFGGGICAATILNATALRLNVEGVELLLGTVAMLGAAHLWYHYKGLERKLATATGSVALMIMAAIMAGIISNAGLRLRRPLIDKMLLLADFDVGVNTPALVAKLSHYPLLIDVLNIAYLSSIPLCLVAVIYLAMTNSVSRAWEAASGFAVNIVIFSVVAALFPAVGLFPHTGVHLSLGDRLPEGAGIYHIGVFKAMYEGYGGTLRLSELNGVVTFPSFHAVTGAIIAWSMRGPQWPAIIASGYGFLVVMSALPIGGHYVVDLIAGLAFWAVLIGWMRSSGMHKMCLPSGK